jgi:hypothetical protein
MDPKHSTTFRFQHAPFGVAASQKSEPPRAIDGRCKIVTGQSQGRHGSIGIVRAL